MDYEIRVVEDPTRRLVCVRDRVAQRELARVIGEKLGLVWKFIRGNDLREFGHNVLVYTHAERDASGVLLLDVIFGVETAATPPAGSGLEVYETNGGRCVTTAHLGDYSGLGGAHEAIEAYVRANNLRETSRWEVYGDPDPDPAKNRTDVFCRVE